MFNLSPEGFEFIESPLTVDAKLYAEGFHGSLGGAPVQRMKGLSSAVVEIGFAAELHRAVDDQFDADEGEAADPPDSP